MSARNRKYDCFLSPIELPRCLRDGFKIACIRSSVTASEQLRQLMAEYVYHNAPDQFPVVCRALGEVTVDGTVITAGEEAPK